MAQAFDPASLSMRLTLEKPVEQPDGQGGHAVSYQAVGIVHARLEPVSAGEEISGATARTITTFRAYLRYRADIAAGMRATRPGRIFMIRAVIRSGARGCYLIATLEEEKP